MEKCIHKLNFWVLCKGTQSFSGNTKLLCVNAKVLRANTKFPGGNGKLSQENAKAPIYLFFLSHIFSSLCPFRPGLHTKQNEGEWQNNGLFFFKWPVPLNKPRGGKKNRAGLNNKDQDRTK